MKKGEGVCVRVCVCINVCVCTAGVAGRVRDHGSVPTKPEAGEESLATAAPAGMHQLEQEE